MTAVWRWLVAEHVSMGQESSGREPGGQSPSPLERAAGLLALKSPGQIMRVLGGAGLLVLAGLAWSWRDLPYDWNEARQGRRPLLAAKTWHYQLTNYDLEKLNKVEADVFVVDYALEGGKVPMTPEQVARLKKKPDGSRRIVISYMSIGEAEEYRYYWQDGWKAQKPAWLGPENCAWPKAHAIRYWRDEWKDLSFRKPESYIKRIIDAGFDGVYLDRVDMYDWFAKENPNSRADMIQYMVELSTQAKKWKPGFFILPQNAEDLLTERRYRRAVDALGKEELLHSGSETGARNPAHQIRQSYNDISHLLWSYKPVFAVEYVLTKEAIAKASAELRSLGIVPTVQTRGLDGNDPTAPVALDKAIGTPERTAAECPKGTAW
jgi:cysteinyl-tRNA synthetase, unknown class